MRADFYTAARSFTRARDLVNQQLSLNLRLNDRASFDNFCGGDNREVVERLRALLADPPTVSGPRLLFLWGENASGKTHLLQAACREVQAATRVALYLPLAVPGLLPAILEEAEHAYLVCLDDLQRVSGDRAWELALFALCERARGTGARIVAAASAGPAHLGLQLPDLATRLGWGPVYQLKPLDDDAKIEAFRLRARNQGLEMPVDVARYILSRHPRDLPSLFALLDRVDRAALASQRRVTIPFIQQLERQRAD
ncbi:MAG: DnaA regulatory inactivator Hda [Gammaproteobacteria bacterium]|nr:DnaA regulatory inactivator Hda [Gammaproteobacteria bacterium]